MTPREQIEEFVDEQPDYVSVRFKSNCARVSFNGQKLFIEYNLDRDIWHLEMHLGCVGFIADARSNDLYDGFESIKDITKRGIAEAKAELDEL